MRLFAHAVRAHPGQDAPEPQRLAFPASGEVRHTVIRVITAHLKKDVEAAVYWQGWVSPPSVERSS
jgi:hypothetical protein